MINPQLVKMQIIKTSIAIYVSLDTNLTYRTEIPISHINLRY